jgi:hypothetical protein
VEFLFFLSNFSDLYPEPVLTKAFGQPGAVFGSLVLQKRHKKTMFFLKHLLAPDVSHGNDGAFQGACNLSRPI